MLRRVVLFDFKNFIDVRQLCCNADTRLTRRLSTDCHISLFRNGVHWGFFDARRHSVPWFAAT